MSALHLELAKVFYLSSFCFGCWTCLSLMVSNKGDRAMKRRMLCFITLLLLPPLNAYVSLVLTRPVPWLQTLSHQLTWMYGPLLLILVQTILLARPHGPSLRWHALPGFFACLALLLDWVSSFWLISLLLLQLLAYFLYTAFCLRGRWSALLNVARQHRNSSYYWLVYLVGGLLLATLIDVTVYLGIMLGVVPAASFVAVIACLLALYVDVIALFALYQPDVFHQSEEHEAQTTQLTQHSESPVISPLISPELSPVIWPVSSTSVETSQPHVRLVELSPEGAQALECQLMALVHSHHPHLDDTISLPKLAALLAVTPHQLSELLNIHMHSSFYDFLNTQRYEESLRMLSQTEQDLSIADIAYRAGFNNRNSFYKVFKDKTGITPAQYKKQARACVTG